MLEERELLRELELLSYAGMVLLAAEWNAAAMFTEVSLTLHLSGFRGVLMTRGPPVRAGGLFWFCCSCCCFSRANRMSAGCSESLVCSVPCGGTVVFSCVDCDCDDCDDVLERYETKDVRVEDIV